VPLLESSLFRLSGRGGIPSAPLQNRFPMIWIRFATLKAALLLFLVWTGRLKPRPGSVGRAFLWLNVYTAGIGLLDWFSGANTFISGESR